MRPLILLCGVVLMAGCGGVKIVGHRGASHDVPENTMASFREAWRQGADGVETDVYLTRDGRLAITHDSTTRRTGGVDWKVSEHTLGELKTLDVGKWKGESWAGERVPVVEELLAIVPRGKRVYVEVKCGPEAVPELKRAVEASGLGRSGAVVISFHENVIAEVKKAMPEVKAYWLFSFEKDKKSGEWNETYQGMIERARKIGADGVDLNANEAVTEHLAEMLRDAGLELHVWTVDDPAVARRMASLGARSITTNRPGWLRAELKKDDPRPKNGR